MATLTVRGTPATTVGELPAVGEKAPAFTVVNARFADVTSEDLVGRRLVLNIFLSIDTAVCAASVRRFNQEAAGLDNVTVLSVSEDLPFALDRFCGAEGIENVVTTSSFRSTFGEDYGVRMLDGPRAGCWRGPSSSSARTAPASTRRCGPCGGRLVHDTQLQPHGLRADVDRLVHHRTRQFRPHEDVDDVDLPRHLGERGVAHGTVDSLGPRVDRDDLLAQFLLHEPGDAVRGAASVARQADDGPPARLCEQTADQGGVVLVSHRTPSSLTPSARVRRRGGGA